MAPDAELEMASIALPAFFALSCHSLVKRSVVLLLSWQFTDKETEAQQGNLLRVTWLRSVEPGGPPGQLASRTPMLTQWASALLELLPSSPGL